MGARPHRIRYRVREKLGPRTTRAVNTLEPYCSKARNRRTNAAQGPVAGWGEFCNWLNLIGRREWGQEFGLHSLHLRKWRVSIKVIAGGKCGGGCGGASTTTEEFNFSDGKFDFRLRWSWSYFVAVVCRGCLPKSTPIFDHFCSVSHHRVT